MWKRFKAWMRERRIKRFRARLKEAYPDAARFIERVAWLDGTDEFMIDGKLHAIDYIFYSMATPEELDRFRRQFN